MTGPGDAIYIPNRWHHATLNVQDSVGVFFNHISAVETEERAREGGGASSESGTPGRCEHVAALL